MLHAAQGAGAARGEDLVLDDRELQRVRDQLQRYDWYRQVFETFRARVDELIERAPPIPVLKGRGFYDSCPDDHAVLAFDPYAPHLHRCPRCGREWGGERYDLAWVRQFQSWLPQRLIEAGILYRVTGEERYTACVRRALMHFAERYEEYPLANNLLGPTRLFQSTYLEAFWLNDMVVAYDLARFSSVFAGEDHEAVRDLFYRSCAVIRSFDEGRSNRQAFNNVGMGAVGLLYGDAELVDYVLSGPHGFVYHMRESLLEDGLWYEGETYHFATLHHLLNLAELARHRGIDLYEGRSGLGALRPMFDGPLGVMLPDLTFPSRKDSWFGRGIAYHKEIYELGYARYGDPRYGGLLARTYAQEGGRETLGWRGFLYADPELPDRPSEELRPTGCERMPGTGVAVLRREEGAVYASLEYGHYGGGHGHPDRLASSLFADGCHWFSDPGTGWYHVPELAWYRSSLAHNLVVVDGVNQTASEGRLTAFGDAGGVQVAQAEVEGAYPGVHLRRTLCLAQGYLLDVFELSSEEEHTYDWVLHTRARLTPASRPVSADLDVAQELGIGDGYGFLADIERLDSPVLSAELTDGDGRLTVTGRGESRLYTARAPGIPLQEERPHQTLLARRVGQSIRFVTVYSRGGPVSLEEPEPGCVSVQIGGRTDLWRVDEEDGVGVVVGDETVAWFGRCGAGLGEVKVEGDRPLSQAALRRSEGGWTVEFPETFGRVRVAGLPFAEPAGLPPGASAKVAKEGLVLEQAASEGVWLPEGGTTPTFFAGCDNRLRFYVGAYDGGSPPEPWLEHVGGCRTVAIHPGHEGEPWEAVLAVPSTARSGRVRLRVTVGRARLELSPTIAAPVRTSWAVVSERGAPAIELRIEDVRGDGGTVTGELAGPWRAGPPERFALSLPPGGAGCVRFSLPLSPPEVAAGQELERVEDAWPLEGLENTEGEYQVAAVLRLEDFVGVSRARLPLYWCMRDSYEAQVLTLGRPGQAYWAEQPWAGEADSSARVRLHWDERGLSLVGEVRDDVQVADASDEDPFENDSLQVYFDFRPPERRNAHFAPGVAAYVLAPAADRYSVRVFPIAGNREISNRTARAEWLTADGVEASAEPTADGYRIRAFFPYESLGVRPLEPGTTIGFDLALSDNDGTWYRKTQLVWSGARGRRSFIRGSYHDPTEYGWLIVGGGS